MKRTGKRRGERQWFESAGALVLGRASTRRRPAASSVRSRRLRNIFTLLLAGVGVGALWLGMDERFYIYRADVVGAVRTSPAAVFQASGLSGLHIFWAGSAGSEDRILSRLPMLEDARVECRLPAECTITVVERQPRVRWEEESGLVWWIDAEGVTFDAEGPLEEGWTVRGPLPRDERGRLDETVRVALTELWATGEELASEFFYVPGRGLVFINQQGWRVILGEGAGMEQRLEVLGRLTTYLGERGFSPQFVDVRLPGAPYYSLVNEW